LKGFFFFITFSLALGFTQLSAKCEPGAVFPVVKQQVREADQFHLAQRSRMVEIYVYFPKRLQGVVLN
jgi:hypothetical protein